MSGPRINLDFETLSPFLEGQGFAVTGAVDFEAATPLYQEHAARYREWITAGKQGEMAYLERGLARRLDPKLVFPDLQSVITVAMPYGPHPVGEPTLRYARYLNEDDYHDVMKSKLERAFLQMAEQKLLPDAFNYKICVDTSAVLERTWAVLSGLGWIGKNTLLIHPQHGSYLFLGVVFTNAIFNKEVTLLKDYCGSCTRCISSCPTEALSSHDLDSRKCISYLTLEQRGSWSAPQPLNGFLAGCDLCQESCPYNTKAVKKSEPSPLLPHLVLDADRLKEESEDEYRARVKGTALSRVKYADFRRNLKSVLSSFET